jgi:predicted ATPase
MQLAYEFHLDGHHRHGLGCVPCSCTQRHERQRIVLTGGPGAGKTAVLELVRRAFCEHVAVLPESAGVVFGGGFPRGRDVPRRAAAQRAIFYVQRELEAVGDLGNPAVVLCDRGTVDALAYWPGPDDFWQVVGTTLAEQLARYHLVLHLRTPSERNGYDRSNPLRIEAAHEAALIDDRIADAWAGHPRRFVVEAEVDFLTKAERALTILRAEIPVCCLRQAPRSLAASTSVV